MMATSGSRSEPGSSSSRLRVKLMNARFSAVSRSIPMENRHAATTRWVASSGSAEVLSFNARGPPWMSQSALRARSRSMQPPLTLPAIRPSAPATRAAAIPPDTDPKIGYSLGPRYPGNARFFNIQ